MKYNVLKVLSVFVVFFDFNVSKILGNDITICLE